MMITDNKLLIRAAKKNYDKFCVPTGSVKSIKTKRTYTPADLADLDVKTSCNLIGEIVNCSQELNTLIWDTYNKTGNLEDVREIYYDASLLDVLSNIEI